MSNLVTYNYQYPGLNKEKSISSKVEIKISCKDLPRFDKLSKSDPKIFIYIEKADYYNNNSIWTNIYSTERVENDNNPLFSKTLIIDYYFETIQNLRFVVFDMDNDNEEWEKNDYIGYTEKTLADIISRSKDKIYSTELLTSVPSGMKIDNSKASSSSCKPQILLEVHEVSGLNYYLNFDIECRNLDKKDIIGKSDPFVIISKIEDDGTKVKVLETSIIKNTLDPKWKDLTISEKFFNNGNPDKMLYFEVYDWDKDTQNDLIGTFQATTRMLFSNKEIEIINEKKKEKKGSKYKNSGYIKFPNIKRIRDQNEPFTFIDYPMGGTEIAVSFAIDFTGSNGLKSLPTSLHYNSPDYNPNNFNTLNQYEKAISAIGSVLEPYDSNRFMEVYGYGGKFFNKKDVEFDCALTGNPNNPSVPGVAGILSAYHQALQTAKLSGPTNFAPIIRKITNEAKQNLLPPKADNPLNKYHILTIITDGIITDMDETKDAIIDACDVPLSIIIIGVGKANFDKMVELDSDRYSLESGNRISTRDLVQFLPLAKFIKDPALLAAETLKEVPKQFMEFVKKNKYKPRFL